ncbi:MAG: bile acid:sodium symporter family protein [bacterium]|jgi:BASS family bile acid:Na+ symporter
MVLIAMEAGWCLAGPYRGGRSVSNPSRRGARFFAPRATRRPAWAVASASASASASPPPSSPSSASQLEKLSNGVQLLFPVWALLSATTAYNFPGSLNWMTTAQFEQGVGLLMLSMGLSLTLDDFRQCLKQPIPILLGFVCQYSVLPILAFTISRLMSLPPSVAIGMILLGSCPGGQASNVATFVAHGNVSLSVLMTTVSTMGAAVMTPLLSTLLAGRYVPIDGVGLALSTVQLVLIPTLLGLTLNEYARKQVDVIRPIMPFVALFLTVVLCAVPVAQVQPVLAVSGAAVILPVVLLHGFGYLLGYLLPKAAFGMDEKTSRTVSIETGMQSAALAYGLSVKHFASDALVSVPASVSIVIMVWMGAALAAFWRMQGDVH